MPSTTSLTAPTHAAAPMLQAPDRPWGLSKEGQWEDVVGSLWLVPELNVKQLAEGPEHLLELFNARMQHAEELVGLEGAHGVLMFQGDLEARDLDFVTRQHAAGRIAAGVMEATLLRQSVLLTSLAVFGDGYRQDVLGRRGSKYTATARGCATCAAREKEGGGKLLLCAACGVVAYCSKRCQAAHWKAGHKAMCHRGPVAVESTVCVWRSRL
jgi:hypothetical protein